MRRALQIIAALLLAAGCVKQSAEPPPAPLPPEPDPVSDEVFIDRPAGPLARVDGELEVAPVRELTCRAESVGASMVVAEVEGAAGEQLEIVPADESCNFHLVYRQGTQTSPLSEQPGGFLVAGARRFADGVRVACASVVAHHPVPGRTRLREIDSVPVLCWAGSTTAFSTSTVVVEGAPDHAAWVRELKPHPTRAGAYVLGWARDFSFQFFSMSDKGRPAADGLYETVLVWNGTSLTAEPAGKVSDRSNPLAGVEPQPYTPTAKEQALFERLNAEIP